MVYNLSAKMLSPIQVRAKRHEFFYPRELPWHGKHHPGHG
jgi:dTDP-glucose 4,6-dehydratase